MIRPIRTSIAARFRWFALLTVATAGAGRAAEFPAGAFFARYCFDCHGESADEDRLRLDRLSAKFSKDGGFADETAAASWLKVYEKLSAGEMPPKDAERPAKEEARNMVGWISAGLHAADAARQRREGRVVLRRLNRTEYENTLRDLLAVEADLKDLLPEDNSAEGFDNVGAALNVSSVLMERYLEAADAALDAALVKSPQPATMKKRFTYKDEKRVTGNKRIFRVIDDGVVFFSSGYSPTNLQNFRAPADGWYRFRVSAYGFQTSRPVTFRVYGGDVIRRDGKTHLIGYYDAPPKTPRVVEFRDRLSRGQSIRVAPYGTGVSRAGKSIYLIGADKYPDPGLAVQWVEVEGPIVEQWPPESHRRLFGPLPLKPFQRQDPRRKWHKWTALQVASESPRKDAEKILRRLAPLAFRRPAADEKIQPHLKLVHDRLDQGYEFEEAMRVGVKALFCSPGFLYFTESPEELDDFAVASRLSYFLWSSMPDKELFHLAAEGALRQPDVLRRQVERMLADPKSRRFTRNFTGQWLNLRDIDFTTPDAKLYPEYDELLKVSMVEETERFFQKVLDDDLSLLNFVDSDFTILNGRLARHYGIEGVTGQEFRVVKLRRGSPRGGVLTQASVLKVTANGTNTSPVMRGVWLLENILGQRPDPPPANVPAVEPDIRGATTIRQQLAKHRNAPSCASCHKRIDPPGFALESFDVIGGWRTFYRSLGAGERLGVTANGRRVQYRRGPAVDAADVMADGRRFDDIPAFKKLLLDDKRQIARGLTEKLLTYATGGGMSFADRAVVDEIVRRIAAEDYGLRTLVHEIVQSKAFLSK